MSDEHKKRWRFWLFATIPLLFALCVGGYYWPVESARDKGSETIKWRNKLVGLTESQAIARFGRPVMEYNLHYGNPPDDYVAQHPAVKTLQFEVEGGTLYASFEMIGSKSVCFQSDFLRAGAAF